MQSHAVSPVSADGRRRRRSYGAIAAIVVTAAVLGGLVGAVIAPTHAVAWARAKLGFIPGLSNHYVYAAGDLDLLAKHVRIGGRDGNFEFEHSRSAATSELNAYYIGTAERTPISVGSTFGDVTSFIVFGAPGQKNDLQRWQAGGKTVAAVDSAGRLHLNGVSIAVVSKGGVTELVARFPNGKEQVLGRSSR